MTKEENKKDKYIYLEFIRIFAIYFVIFNHTSEMGFFLFADEPMGSIKFWAYMIVTVLSKVAVPLFFCVSGALLLGRELVDIGNLWKNRILKIALILVFFSTINYVNYCFYAGKEFDFLKMLQSFYSGPSVVNGHLWYLYAYIVFLILLPFLQAMVQKLETKYFGYLIFIVLIFEVLHVLEYVLIQGKVQMSDDIRNNLWIMADVVIYPCLGYFVQHRFEVKKIGKKLPILWGLNLLGIAVSCYMTYFIGQVTGEINEWFSQEFLDSFVVLNAICIFTTAKYVFETKPVSDKISKWIVSIGKTTFGIYLIHQLFKCYFSHYEIIPKITTHGVDSMVAVLLYCFGVLIVCCALTLILLRIPVVKKLIGG